MTKRRVYVYRCDDCDDTFDLLVEYAERDLGHTCTTCGKQDCERTWYGWTPNVSTRNSATMPASVGKGRFDKYRERQILKKEKAHARETGDSVTEKKINRESKKL